MNASIKYRADIDGLRAIAVLPVVLYHAGVPNLSGGYVGVDVFFVISGFLIAGIVSREISENRFSLVNFYERRARRILPALFSVLTTTLLAAWALSWPTNFQEIAESVLATVFFSSNFYFWQTTDYFSTAAEYRPLLHTWSLAVEEQFYIIFPLLLMLFAHRFRQALLGTLLIAFFSSFLLSAFGAEYKPVASFYLSPSRAWELLLGVFLAMNFIPSWSSRYLREAAAAVGLALIGVSIFSFDASTPFPGWTALMPCLGAALLIQVGRGNMTSTWVSKLLSHPLLVFVGLISYSLYLWHWPILAFSRSWLETTELPFWWAFSCVTGSLVISAMSWHIIERPFRTKGVVTRRAIFQASSVGALMLLGCGAVVVSASGFPNRFPTNALLALGGSTDIEENRKSCMGRKPDGGYCVIGNSKNLPSVVLWGDSHAAALMSAAAIFLQTENRSAFLASHSGCPPLLGIRRVGDSDWHQCREFNQEAVMLIQNNAETVDYVVLAARWPLNVTGRRAPGESGDPVRLESLNDVGVSTNPELVEAGLRRTVSVLTDLGVDVIILGAVPEIGWDVPRTIATSVKRGIAMPELPSIEDMSARHRVANQILQRVSAMQGVLWIPLVPLLCDPVCEVLADSKPVYVDDDHLSEHGARTVLGPRLASVLTELGAPFLRPPK